MQQNRLRTVLRLVLIGVGFACLLLAVLAGIFGALGMAGVLADVGPDENQRMGSQALWFAAVIFGAGLAALIGGLVLPKSDGVG